jgi:hypothetical protein
VNEIQIQLVNLREKISDLHEDIYSLGEDQINIEVSQLKGRVQNLYLLVENASTALKVERINSYLELSRQRLSVLRQNITSNSVAVKVKAASLYALNQAVTSLNSADSYLENGNFSAAMDALRSSRGQEQVSIEIMKNAGVDVGGTSSSSTNSGNVSPESAESTSKPSTLAQDTSNGGVFSGFSEIK